MWRRVNSVPENILNRFLQKIKDNPNTNIYEYAEYKLVFLTLRDRVYYQRTRVPSLFIENLWTEFASDYSTDPNILYVTDWSCTDTLTPPILRKTTAVEEYTSLTVTETEGLNIFFRECLELSVMPHEFAVDHSILKLLQNRLIMDALRYAKLETKGYLKYNLSSSISLRVGYAFETETYEPFIDAFNIIFLLSLKYPNRHEGIVSQGANMLDNIWTALCYEWPLGATDDGVHSEKM